MNREELKQAALTATGPCLKEKGYIKIFDVFIAMGKLSRQDYERWRHGHIPFLESVIHLNLKQLVEVLRTVRANSLKGGLKPSWTAYLKPGGGPRRPLRFTKTGNDWLEKLYATHYVKGLMQDEKKIAQPLGGSVHAAVPALAGKRETEGLGQPTQK